MEVSQFHDIESTRNNRASKSSKCKMLQAKIDKGMLCTCRSGKLRSMIELGQSCGMTVVVNGHAAHVI